VEGSKMCELLGICANCQVGLEFSLVEWRNRGLTSPQGYGFAHWSPSGAKILKEPVSLWGRTREPEKEPLQLHELRTVRSSMFLCHVRIASVGGVSDLNTHPFSAAAHGRAFVFAHNGTVGGIKGVPLRCGTPAGQTDSEHAFLWLLERLPDSASHEFAACLKDLADLVVNQYGKFNFLMSVGTTLWAYADTSLWFVERKPPFDGRFVRLRDEGYAISLADVKRSNEKAVLVATELLTSDGEKWTRMPSGELPGTAAGEVRERLGAVV